jgi:spore maturation protein CgeB
MDIMGAGGFLLSNYQQELAEYFEVGKELVLYDSREDLMQKIDYYLCHEEERQEIARCGQRKIEENFSYRKVLPRIFSVAD